MGSQFKQGYFICLMKGSDFITLKSGLYEFLVFSVANKLITLELGLIFTSSLQLIPMIPCMVETPSVWLKSVHCVKQ